MKSIKKSPVTVQYLPIEGDTETMKAIVRERWERLKRGDTDFMGYIKKQSFIQKLINIWKQV